MTFDCRISAHDWMSNLQHEICLTPHLDGAVLLIVGGNSYTVSAADLKRAADAMWALSRPLNKGGGR